MKGAPKSNPLRQHLAGAASRGQKAVDMDFAQVADLVGGVPGPPPLPLHARKVGGTYAARKNAEDGQ